MKQLKKNNEFVNKSLSEKKVKLPKIYRRNVNKPLKKSDMTIKKLKIEWAGIANQQAEMINWT